MAVFLSKAEGSVIATAITNVRRGQPNRSAVVSRRLNKGDAFKIIGAADGEMVAGESTWFAGENEEFVWAGAVNTDSARFDGVSGLRRPDGTLRPLPNARIESLYGRFAYTEGAGGRVTVDPAWAAEKIVSIDLPASILGGRKIQVHVLAAPYFRAAFEAVAARGFADRILTFDGTHVSRHKGWDPQRDLSSHSWGIAIDLNARWNGYGSVPAPLGVRGSVREIVPIFEAQGFAWGGRFQPQSICDGMHFELARLDPSLTA